MGPKLLEAGEHDTRGELIKLMALVAKQNHSLFSSLLKTHVKDFAQVLKLSPAEATEFQHSAHLTTYQRRQISRFFNNKWGFTPLPSETEQAQFEQEVTESFNVGELDRGKMSLFKRAGDLAPSPCYYARIKNLPAYIGQEVREALEEEFEDPAVIQNLRSPMYQGRLRLTIGGDKGGQSTKVTAMLGGGREPLVLGLFYGADNGQNLQIFFGEWTLQLRQLSSEGLSWRDPSTGQVCTMAVDILVNGDMAFEYEVCGHSGAAARKPMLYRHVLRMHLQKDHRLVHFYVCVLK